MVLGKKTMVLWKKLGYLDTENYVTLIYYTKNYVTMEKSNYT